MLAGFFNHIKGLILSYAWLGYSTTSFEIFSHHFVRKLQKSAEIN